MTSISFLFFSSPYLTQSCETLTELANAAMEKGIKVKIFALMDGVYGLIPKQKKVGNTTIEERFEKLIKNGAEIKLCTICMLVRGTAKNLISGAKRGGTPDLENYIEDTDRMIVIY